MLNESLRRYARSYTNRGDESAMTTHDHTAGESYLALSVHSKLPRLTIERIETVALRVPLHKRYSGSAYSMVNRCTIITRLYTHEGIIGEVYTGDTDAEQDTIVRIIHEELAPVLVGQDAMYPERCWQLMQPSTYDILRDRGLALQAIACIDAAIWDAFGGAWTATLPPLGCLSRSAPDHRD